MGAWGVGPWQNDDALDWLGELEDLAPSARVDAVTSALDRAGRPGYLEAPAMSEAVAAAALVGAAYNPRAAHGTEHLPAWLGDSDLATEQELVERARRTLRRAAAEGAGEWFELWAESGLAPDVRAEMRRVLAWLGDRDD